MRSLGEKRSSAQLSDLMNRHGSWRFGPECRPLKLLSLKSTGHRQRLAAALYMDGRGWHHAGSAQRRRFDQPSPRRRSPAETKGAWPRMRSLLSAIHRLTPCSAARARLTGVSPSILPKSPRKAFNAKRSVSISFIVRNPALRRIGSGGHQP